MELADPSEIGLNPGALSAGLVEGFAYPRRLERLADLAIAAAVTSPGPNTK